jgi:hypothetical protein
MTYGLTYGTLVLAVYAVPEPLINFFSFLFCARPTSYRSPMPTRKEGSGPKAAAVYGIAEMTKSKCSLCVATPVKAWGVTRLYLAYGHAGATRAEPSLAHFPEN